MKGKYQDSLWDYLRTEDCRFHPEYIQSRPGGIQDDQNIEKVYSDPT